jgi:hypothetical protein
MNLPFERATLLDFLGNHQINFTLYEHPPLATCKENERKIFKKLLQEK